MLSLTKLRMIDFGIACDVICLTKPPLHVVPLFKLKAQANEVRSGRGDSKDVSSPVFHLID